MKAWTWLVVAAALGVGVEGVAQAQRKAPAKAEDPAADTTLVQAQKAWEEAELTRAADLYEQALKEGNLYPSDVLVAYARIGTVRAAMNQRNAALSAFRVAAALDPSFELPSEAGPKAKALYKQARAEAEKQGGKLDITAEVPTQSAPGATFIVTAHVPEAFVPLIVDVGITVSDPSVSSSTVKPYKEKKPAATEVQFEVPGKVVVPGANLLVRVDALDGHGNRWASAQSRVKVDARKRALEPMPGDAMVPGEDDHDGKKKSGGFWGGPWPWVIGGAVVVGGVATYFMTRPTPDVAVGAPTWR
jgi:hypothetical protein